MKCVRCKRRAAVKIGTKQYKLCALCGQIVFEQLMGGAKQGFRIARIPKKANVTTD